MNNSPVLRKKGTKPGLGSFIPLPAVFTLLGVLLLGALFWSFGDPSATPTSPAATPLGVARVEEQNAEDTEAAESAPCDPRECAVTYDEAKYTLFGTAQQAPERGSINFTFRDVLVSLGAENADAAGRGGNQVILLGDLPVQGAYLPLQSYDATVDTYFACVDVSSLTSGLTPRAAWLLVTSTPKPIVIVQYLGDTTYQGYDANLTQVITQGNVPSGQSSYRLLYNLSPKKVAVMCVTSGGDPNAAVWAITIEHMK